MLDRDTERVSKIPLCVSICLIMLLPLWSWKTLVIWHFQNVAQLLHHQFMFLSVCLTRFALGIGILGSLWLNNSTFKGVHLFSSLLGFGREDWCHSCVFSASSWLLQEVTAPGQEIIMACNVKPHVVFTPRFLHWSDSTFKLVGFRHSVSRLCYLWWEPA